MSKGVTSDATRERSREVNLGSEAISAAVNIADVACSRSMSRLRQRWDFFDF